MRLRSAFLLLLLRTLSQAAYARRTLGTASTGTVVPSTAMAAMLETLQVRKRPILTASLRATPNGASALLKPTNSTLGGSHRRGQEGGIQDKTPCILERSAAICQCL